MTTAAPTPKQVSQAMAELMPSIVRGVQLDFFLKRGVTQTQFLVIAAIHADRSCAMGALARNLHVSLPTASGVVDRLVRDGYVRRAPHPSDRRQVIVQLTAKGASFVRQFQEVIRRRWEDVLRTLPAKELEAFRHVIVKLRDQLQVSR